VGEQMALYSACASGCEREKIFDNSAFGYWLLAFGQKNQQRTRPSMDAFTLRPSADALSLGIAWDTMGLTGMNIGVGEGGRKHPYAKRAQTAEVYANLYPIHVETAREWADWDEIGMILLKC
jgi:hypothetical protein